MSKELDNKIFSLNYRPEEVLVLKGEHIENVKQYEGRKDNGKYIVINREKVSLGNTSSDIGIIDSMIDLTWPGALVLANSNLVGNQPDPLSISRTPLKLYIDLPGMAEQSLFTVEEPSYGNVSTQIDKKLTLWNKEYSAKNSIVARSFYTEDMVFSESQLAVKFGCEIKKLSKELNIDFTAASNKKKSIFIASYRQVFYTVSLAKLPNAPSDVFSESVTWEQLQQRGVNDKNPPALIYKVAYGRTIFVKIETDYCKNDVQAIMSAAMKGGEITDDTKYNEVFEHATFTAVVMGGSSKGHHEVITSRDLGAIKKVINDYSEYSEKNPGYPISYSSVFLKDNKVAAVNSSTDYIKSTYTEYQNANIILNHVGGYVAQFRVEWDEVSFDTNGNKCITRKGWEGNSKDRTAPFSTTITLQGNAENVCVFAKECTGLAWEWWRTIFDVKNIALVPNRTFKIYGTTLNQKYSISPSLQ